MSRTDVRLRCFASPVRARSLFTVRAAISSAFFSDSPRSRRPSLMWSYCRSRFWFHACCGIATPWRVLPLPFPRTRHEKSNRRREVAHLSMECPMIRPTADDVAAAQDALAGHVRWTPVLGSEQLDETAGCPVVFKAESLQVTGSFKVRGAFNRIRTLPEEARRAGLITVSAGNAALRAAYAARVLGGRLTVVMPEHAVPEKLSAVRALGATVICEGIHTGQDAFGAAAALVARDGLTMVPPFDDPMVVAGAATATAELLRDAPDIRRVVVPCSGGGLLSGAILAVAASGRTVDVVGVQPDAADAIVQSLATGMAVRLDHADTVADGLTAPGPGELNYAMIRDAGVRIVTVSDPQILDAMTAVVRSLRVVIEPSAAAGLAALASVAALRQDVVPTGVVLSGSNVNWQLLADRVVGP